MLGPFEDFSKISSEAFQHLRTITNSSDYVRKFSDDFWTLPKISKDFMKILKNHKNIWLTLLDRRFRSFLKIFGNFERFRSQDKGSCVYGKYKWRVAYATVSHSKALHN